MTAAKPVPDDIHTISPYITVEGADDAVTFYTKAFNATETYRMAGPDGKLYHAQLKIGDSTLMLSDAFPEWGANGPTKGQHQPVTLHAYFENADEMFDQAVAAGATVLEPMTDQFWGDRMGKLEDPFGHRWTIAVQVEKLTPEQIKERMMEWAKQQG